MSVKFDKLRYARCYEDFSIMKSILNVNENDTVISIISGGDNTLNFLLENPKKVIALDLNPTQIYLFELKILSIKKLDWLDIIFFLGYKEDSKRSRLAIYNDIKSELSLKAQEYFEMHSKDIENGIIFSGKFDNFMEKLYTYIFKFYCKRWKQIGSIEDKEDKEIYYNKYINTFSYKLIFKLISNEYIVGKFGRDKEMFKYNNQDFTKHIKQELKRVLLLDNFNENEYIQAIFFKNMILPPFLKEENFEIIKKNLNKIEIQQKSFSSTLELLEKDMYKCNLSNIYEYFSPELMDSDLTKMQEKFLEGSRIAYFNMIVRRNFENNNLDDINTSELKKNDKLFFYSAVYGKEF